MNSRETAIQVKGKTLQAALQTASEMFGVPTSGISYEVKKKGFLGAMLSGRTEILAWLTAGNSANGGTSAPRSSGERSNGRSQGKPSGNGNGKTRFPRRKLASAGARTERLAKDTEPLTSEQQAVVETELRDYLVRLAGSIVGDKIKLQSRFDETYGFQRLILDIEESEFSQMILDNPKLRESLEHLIRKKPRHLKRELPFRIFVDGSGKRQAHEADLRKLADELSEKAIRDDKPVVLESQSAYDRKIVHMALDKNTLVYTKSVGMGAKRKLMIIPSKSDSAIVQS